MAIIAVAGDVSKGYTDFCFQNEAGSVLPPTGCYDDTPEGHQRLRQAMAQLAAQHPGVEFVVGVESTGGLENNWLALFRSLDLPCQVYRLNPLAVRRFLERDLHRNITDESSARGIAEYLRSGLRPADVPYEPQMEAPRVLLRHTLRCLERGAQVRTTLQSLLPSVHPDLVRYCRQGIPQCMLHVLVEFPTARQLAAASVQQVAAIPYLTEGRARKLIAEAQRSVASGGDALTAQVVGSLAQEALDLLQKVKDFKAQLWETLKSDEEVRILKSIPGIGRWTATILRLEVGPFHRFRSDNAVVAYGGLDSRIEQSGDGEKHRHISRHGKAHIRACLQMPVLTALREKCPAITQFYQRLTQQKGKPHQLAVTACMGKLLRIAYACVVSGQEFDAARHEQVQRGHEEDKAAAEAAKAAGGPTDSPAEGRALDAPVSWREAKRRRAVAEALAKATAGTGGMPGATSGAAAPQAVAPAQL